MKAAFSRRELGQGSERSARLRSLSGRVNVLAIQGSESVLRQQPHVVGHRSRCSAGFAHVPDGPERDGQDHAAEMRHGSSAHALGSIEFDGIDLAKRPAEQRARIGIGYVPQGRESFRSSLSRRICGSVSGSGRAGPSRFPDHISICFRC